MNGYTLTRQYRKAKFGKNIPTVSDTLFLYLLDKWNALQQPETFGLPTDYTMEQCEIRSYKTFKKALDGLIKIGIIKLFKEAKNQFEAKIVGFVLVKNTEAYTKPNTKARTTIIEQSRKDINNTEYKENYIKENEKTDIPQLKKTDVAILEVDLSEEKEKKKKVAPKKGFSTVEGGLSSNSFVMCPYPAFCENETLSDNWNLIIQLQEETLKTKFKKPKPPKRFMQNWERNQLNTLIKNSKNDIQTAIAITNYMIAKPTSNVPTWNSKKQNYGNKNSNNNGQYFSNTSSQLEKNNWSAGI